MDKITVMAKQGTKCPMEGNPREYITGKLKADVPNTAYYRRRLRDGSLILVTAQTPKGGDKS